MEGKIETRTKRAYGRGYIRQRGNSYNIAISLGKDPVTKRYKYQWATIKGTRKDAEKKLAEMLRHKSLISKK